jgi:molybdopterin/thiamine biosynthesis adenylyltransferase
MPALIASRVAVEDVVPGLRIAVVGTGSVGGRAAMHWARLGVAELWLVDPKSYKSESVLTHGILPGEVGRPKAATMARRCKLVSPRTRVFSFVGRVQDLPWDAFAEVDLVVMAPDNLAAEVATGQRCLHLGRPLVHASLHGESLTAHVRFFVNSDCQGPCPVCGYGEAEREQARAELQDAPYSCAGDARIISHPPTRSFSGLCSFAADLAMNQALRHLLGLGEPVGDTITEYCGFTNRITTSRLERNPACEADHARLKVVEFSRALAAYNLSELAQTLGFVTGDESLTFIVGEAEWLERGSCGCAHPSVVRRFVPAGARELGVCGKCRAKIRIQPFFARREVSALAFGKDLCRPLTELGAKRVRWILARNATTAILARNARSRREVA